MIFYCVQQCFAMNCCDRYFEQLNMIETLIPWEKNHHKKPQTNILKLKISL